VEDLAKRLQPGASEAHVHQGLTLTAEGAALGAPITCDVNVLGQLPMEGLFSSFPPWLWSGVCWPTPVPHGPPPDAETSVHVWVGQEKKDMV